MEVIFHRRITNTLGLNPLCATKNFLASIRCMQCTDPKRWKFKLSEKHLHYGNLSRNSVPLFNHININPLAYKYNVTKCSIPIAKYCNLKQTNKEVPGNACKTQKLSLFAKMKGMAKDYWHILIPVHIITSAGWVIIFYTMIKNGVDIVKILEFLHFSQKYLDMVRNSNAGSWVLTYGLYKIFTPFRYAVTLGATTMTIKHLGKLGLAKPFPIGILSQILSKTTDSNKTKLPNKTSLRTDRHSEPPKT